MRLDPRGSSPRGRYSRRTAALLCGALLLLAAASSAAPPPRLHFDGPRTLPLAAREDPFLLRKKLYPALKRAGIDRIELIAGDASIVQERSPSGMMYLDGLPLPALHGVLLMLPAECAGAEIDLVVEGTGAPDDPDRMWTVRRDLAGGIVVLRGGPPLVLEGPDPGAAELSARFGIGALEDFDAAWSADERRALARALELLSPEELALVAGTTFVRARRDRGGLAGLHVPSRLGEPSRIRLFDAAFSRSGASAAYVGSPERAFPHAVFVILHQIGHAVARAERRRLLLERGEQVDSYAVSTLSFQLASRERARAKANAGAGAPAERQLQIERELARTHLELQQRFAAIAKLDVRLEELRTGLGSAERRYAQLPGALEGPTQYGRTDARESFAEAFALYHIDPESLRRIAPQAHAWFTAAGHLQSPELPDVAAPRLEPPEE